MTTESEKQKKYVLDSLNDTKDNLDTLTSEIHDLISCINDEESAAREEAINDVLDILETFSPDLPDDIYASITKQINDLV